MVLIEELSCGLTISSIADTLTRRPSGSCGAPPNRIFGDCLHPLHPDA